MLVSINEPWNTTYADKHAGETLVPHQVFACDVTHRVCELYPSLMAFSLGRMAPVVVHPNSTSESVV